MDEYTFLQPKWPSWFINLRPHQAQAISEAMAAFNSGTDVVIMQAPTGSGKTVIAEYIRRLLNVRGVYTCSTKALQDQVLRAFPYSRVLKGRSNYPTELYPERFSADDNSFSQRITCGDCPGKDRCNFCTDEHTCPYQIAKVETLDAPLAVLNTSYLLTETNLTYRSNFVGHPFKIIDECDELEGELLRFSSVTITKSQQHRYRIDPPAKKTVPDTWLGWTFHALERLQRAYDILNAQATHTEADTIRRRRELSGLSDKLRKVKLVQNGLVDDNRTGERSWVYTDYDSGSITFKPIQVNTFGSEYLFSHPGKKLLMSGTVISPSFMADNLGIDSYSFVNVPTTFPADKRPVYFHPVGQMSRKYQQATLPKLIDKVVTLATKYPDSRILIHTHSYKLSGDLFSSLRGDFEIGDRLLTYNSSDEKDNAIRDYINTPNSIIIASSLDRGYDFPDDMCRVQIICKVPFPYLGDKQVQARTYSTKGGNLWYIVQTIRSIVQMTGRGMRSVDDEVETYILDEDFERVYKQRKSLFPQYWKDAYQQE